METQNAEIILDHRTRSMDLFCHGIYDLFEWDCARAPNRSSGVHHYSGIKQLEFVPSGQLTTVQNSLRVCVLGGGGDRGYKLGP